LHGFKGYEAMDVSCRAYCLLGALDSLYSAILGKMGATACLFSNSKAPFSLLFNILAILENQTVMKWNKAGRQLSGASADDIRLSRGESGDPRKRRLLPAYPSSIIIIIISARLFIY
jgi:hypothetical protein